MLLTATTSARPIISPVAVAAVRPGIRAGGVGGQPALDSEQPAKRPREQAAIGAITNGDAIAIPKKIAIVPIMPAAATIGVVSSAAPSQKAPPSPSTIRTVPIAARRGRGRERRPSVPSTARIGEVRPARRAGHIAPATDVPTPTTTATTGAHHSKRSSPTGTSSTSRVIAIRP